MKQIRFLSQGAMIAALYVALVLLQNLLLPGSSSMAVQFRVAEALCVLAFFTPSAIFGLCLGCLLANFFNAGALPLDFLVGTAASLLACGGMYGLRRVKLFRLPLPGLLLPALTNGLLVGWELTVYLGQMPFWLNALLVFAGEAAVLLSLGLLLYFALLPLERRGLFGR